jgi:hypothetical protein
MSRHIYYFLFNKIMKLFNNLLEIKTWKKEHPLKAIFIENSLFWEEWAYFIYHYDILHHTFYINDLDYLWTKNRTSAINIIEHIITEAFYQEMLNLPCHLARIQISKNPKVYSFYKQKNWLIVIDKINLKTIRAEKNNIIKFINPTWNINDNDNIKLEKIKESIAHFYLNKNISK